jgi:hypothetical protein
VQGPQYATGVGLVRYGADRLADSAVREHAAAPVHRHAEQPALHAAAERRNGFWNWFRAAF